jgi:hypothetical protein
MPAGAVLGQREHDLGAHERGVLRYLDPVSVDLTPSEQDERSPRLRAAIAVAALAVAVLAGLGVRWWTHPTIFRDLGDAFVSDPLPVSASALSTTVIFPKVDGTPETVTIDHARAVFSKNTAKATATFWICHLGAGEDPIGAVHDPKSHCRDIVPLETGSTFRHGVAPGSDYLFVTVTPTTVGVAHLAEVEVRYRRAARHLYQQGTESIRADRKITAQ